MSFLKTAYAAVTSAVAYSPGGDGAFGCAINVEVDDVDAVFAAYRARGLDPSRHADSPVHQGPIDQTWGWREFYVTDPDGNTLRFRRPLSEP